MTGDLKWQQSIWDKAMWIDWERCLRRWSLATLTTSYQNRKAVWWKQQWVRQTPNEAEMKYGGRPDLNNEEGLGSESQFGFVCLVMCRYIDVNDRRGCRIIIKVIGFFDRHVPLLKALHCHGLRLGVISQDPRSMLYILNRKPQSNHGRSSLIRTLTVGHKTILFLVFCTLPKF
jgi:hypothetical protein